MSLAAAVAPRTDPYSGGGKYGARPPTAITGPFAAANTRVGNPIGGVNPGTPNIARNNEGSNICIPYARLVPLSSAEGAALPADPETAAKMSSAQAATRASVPAEKRKAITEIEDLRATCVAFVLAEKRAKLGGPNVTGQAVPSNSHGLGNASLGSANWGRGLRMHQIGGFSGTDRFQRLCSMEYLERWFKCVLRGVSLEIPEDLQAVPALTYESGGGGFAGLVTQYLGVDIAGAAGSPGDERRVKLLGGAVRAAAPAAKPMEGIFCADYGPFIRGKSSHSGLVNRTTSGMTIEDPFDPTQTMRNTKVNECLGEETAFRVFDEMLKAVGLMDWSPDGVVKSKGLDDPSDQLSDEALKARDGALFNIAVQGPQLTSTWSGEGKAELEVLPLDKVFVALVADVWFDKFDQYLEVPPGSPAGTAASAVPWLAPFVNASPDSAAVKAYMEGKERMLKIPFTFQEMADFQGQQWFAEEINVAGAGTKTGTGKAREKVTMTNFRPMLMTSSQMTRYSQFRAVEDGATPGAYTAAGRCGLRLGKGVGEYVVGAWCIGNVLDKAAARGSMPGGSVIGMRAAPNSYAHTINVNISWWNGDMLWRTFMNKEGSTTARYEKNKDATWGPNLPYSDPTSWAAL